MRRVGFYADSSCSRADRGKLQQGSPVGSPYILRSPRELRL